MQSCAELFGMNTGWTVEALIFVSASARAPGFRVNCALMASARNSRERPTFIIM